MKRKHLRLYAMILIGLLSCSPKKAPSSVSGSEASGGALTSGGSVLSSVKVEEDAQGLKVIFDTSRPASPNIFRLSDPDRIVVDFADTKMTGVSNVTPVGKGIISEINANQFDDGATALTRIVLSLSASSEYQAETLGDSLVLRLGSNVASTPAATESTEPAPAVAEAPVVADPSPAISAEAPLSETPTAVSTPVKLVDIQYSSSSSGTIVRLITDGPVENMQDFMLYDPSRIVVDLKGVSNAYKGKKTISLKTPEVTNLRVGGTKEEPRIVLDVKGKTAPTYNLTRDGNDLILQVNAAEPVAEVAQASPANETPAVETPVQADAPAAVEAVAPSEPVVATKPVTITSVDFKQMETLKKSRVSIGLSSADATYTTKDLGNKRFAVVVDRAKIKAPTLKRPIDTREFKSAVMSVTPKTVGKNTEFVVQLEQDVPYVVTQDGNFLQIDVDVPDQILRAQTPTTTVAQNAPAAETPSDSSTSTIGAAQEKIIPDESAAAIAAAEENAPKPTTKSMKDYRYVKEEFMNDSMNDNEPLSRMAAILGGTVDGKKFTGRKISLDFKDADVRSVFRLIADISKFNIIISDDVEGRITIRLDDVPWDQAFAIILQTRSLWFEKYGNIVRIAPADKLRKEREIASAAQKAAKAAKPLDVLFKPVSFAEAGTLMKQVGSMLSERGSVDIDSRTNTLIIKDIREHLDRAKKLVDILDTQTPQVTIEARIVEATTTFTRSFGIQWFGQTGLSPRTGNPTGLFFPNSVEVPFAMNFPIDAGFENTRVDLKLGSINDILDIDLALRLGEQEGHSKLISAPKITVLDNKSATITAGSRIPFITQTANAGSNIRFENAATTLSVTPHITNEGSILMTIAANRNEPNFAQAIQGNPLIDQRSANTEVLVKSGNTTVIGGIYSTQQANSESRLPFISKIPIIGVLFKNYNRSIRRTELLIFVTPRIVGDEREAIKDVRG